MLVLQNQKHQNNLHTYSIEVIIELEIGRFQPCIPMRFVFHSRVFSAALCSAMNADHAAAAPRDEMLRSSRAELARSGRFRR